MSRHPAVRPSAALLVAALVAGCASEQATPPAEMATEEMEARQHRFDVSTGGMVGIALLTAVAVFALMVSSDDSVSFD